MGEAELSVGCAKHDFRLGVWEADDPVDFVMTTMFLTSMKFPVSQVSS